MHLPRFTMDNINTLNLSEGKLPAIYNESGLVTSCVVL